MNTDLNPALTNGWKPQFHRFSDEISLIREYVFEKFEQGSVNTPVARSKLGLWNTVAGFEGLSLEDLVLINELSYTPNVMSVEDAEGYFLQPYKSDQRRAALLNLLRDVESHKQTIMLLRIGVNASDIRQTWELFLDPSRPTFGGLRATLTFPADTHPNNRVTIQPPDLSEFGEEHEIRARACVFRDNIEIRVRRVLNAHMLNGAVKVHAHACRVTTRGFMYDDSGYESLIRRLFHVPDEQHPIKERHHTAHLTGYVNLPKIEHAVLSYVHDVACLPVGPVFGAFRVEYKAGMPTALELIYTCPLTEAIHSNTGAEPQPEQAETTVMQDLKDNTTVIEDNPRGYSVLSSDHRHVELNLTPDADLVAQNQQTREEFVATERLWRVLSLQLSDLGDMARHAANEHSKINEEMSDEDSENTEYYQTSFDNTLVAVQQVTDLLDHTQRLISALRMWRSGGVPMLHTTRVSSSDKTSDIKSALK
jgi:hypothetical protein